MSNGAELASIALSVGKVHGAIVASVVRGGQRAKSTTTPLTKEALDGLRRALKLTPQDHDRLKQIVALSTDPPANPSFKRSLLQIGQIDKELRGKPEGVNPLVLAVSGIASDSAKTELARLKAPRSRTRAPRQFTKDSVVAADVAGAILGGIAGAKAGRDLESTLVGAIGGAILASSEVGAGRPFPHIGVVVE